MALLLLLSSCATALWSQVLIPAKHSLQGQKNNEDIGKAGALGKGSSPKTVSKVAIIHVLYACI